MPDTPEGGSVLAFDYGTRTIGVAVGNRISASARALTTVANGDWSRLDAVVAEWRPDRLVVGLPLARDGGEQPTARAAREFAAALERRYARPTDLVDERLSSREAAGRFAARRAAGLAKRKHADAIDALAAEVILETWLAARA
ncbi:MAG TPA: Holliday junction resolvase RuvX [Dokdonella sp.]